MIKWATEYNSRLRGISACQLNASLFGKRYLKIRMPARRVLKLLSSRSEFESPGRPEKPADTRAVEAYREIVSRGEELVPPVMHADTETLGDGEPVLVYNNGGGRSRVAVAIEHGETEVPVDLFVVVNDEAHKDLDFENTVICTLGEYHDLARSSKLAELAGEISSELEDELEVDVSESVSRLTR